jgi:hypothetical protein
MSWIFGTLLVLSIELAVCVGYPRVGASATCYDSGIQKLQAPTKNLTKETECRVSAAHQIQNPGTVIEPLRDKDDARYRYALWDIANTHLTTFAESRLSKQATHGQEPKSLSQLLTARIDFVEVPVPTVQIDIPVGLLQHSDESVRESEQFAGNLMLQIYLWVPVLLGIFLMLCILRAIFKIVRQLAEAVLEIFH